MKVSSLDCKAVSECVRECGWVGESECCALAFVLTKLIASTYFALSLSKKLCNPVSVPNERITVGQACMISRVFVLIVHIYL